MIAQAVHLRPKVRTYELAVSYNRVSVGVVGEPILSSVVDVVARICVLGHSCSVSIVAISCEVYVS